MSITLYHCHDARSMRCLWTLEELGVDYNLVNMEFPPRYRHQGYLEINPLGTVPTLITDGVTMTESSAIAQYLVEKYGPSELGLDISHPEYPLYLNWLQRSDATLTFPLALILRYNFWGDQKSKLPQVVDDYTQWFLSRLRCVDDALKDRDYLVADRFTIVDICVGFAIYFARKLKLSKNFGSETQDYLMRITGREAFKRVLAKQAELLERQPELKTLFD
jgi:glutathione S-transferase